MADTGGGEFGADIHTGSASVVADRGAITVVVIVGTGVEKRLISNALAVFTGTCFVEIKDCWPCGVVGAHPDHPCDLTVDSSQLNMAGFN